jgi:hypothetical protein
VAENWEGNVVCVNDVLFDHFGVRELLVHELAAGESEDLQTLLRVFIVKNGKICVVLASQTSLGGHIHHDYGLLILEPGHFNKFSICVDRLERKEILLEGSLESFRFVFENDVSHIFKKKLLV